MDDFLLSGFSALINYLGSDFFVDSSVYWFVICIGMCDHDLYVCWTVSEVANKIIWDCIVDDPILFLRHFLEKLTNKERQVGESSWKE